MTTVNPPAGSGEPPNSENWVGNVVTMLGADEDRAKGIVRTWTDNGVIEPFKYIDPITRKPGRTGLRVNAERRPDRAPENFDLS